MKTIFALLALVTMSISALTAAESKVPINSFCPVMPDEPIDSYSRLVDYEGKTYGLCCGSCLDDWNADPEKWAAVVAEQMQSAAESAEAVQAAEPAKIPVNTHCPVMPEEPVDADSRLVVYQGKTYGLCCGSCMDDWNAEPAKFAALAAQQLAAENTTANDTRPKGADDADERTTSQPSTKASSSLQVSHEKVKHKPVVTNSANLNGDEGNSSD